jgi:hypothetical protein
MRKVGLKSQFRCPPIGLHPQPCSWSSYEPKASIKWHPSRCAPDSITAQLGKIQQQLLFYLCHMMKLATSICFRFRSRICNLAILGRRIHRDRHSIVRTPWRASTAFQNSPLQFLLYLPSSLPITTRTSVRDTGHSPDRRTSKQSTFTGTRGSPHGQHLTTVSLK